MHLQQSSDRISVWMIVLTLLLTVYAAGNVAINYLGKGSQWDVYPAAELGWVIVSVVVVAKTTSPRRLFVAVIVLLLLDSFVDECAMGNACWWASPPVLVEWKWSELRDSGRLYPLIYGYWFCTWGLQVPARCFALARAVSGGWGRMFWIVSLGLNLIWFTAPQDVLFYFVWLGLYDWNARYFDYLPPAGFWNLWNMLLLRVPIGATLGALVVRAGLRDRRDWWTTALITLAFLAIALLVVICLREFSGA
jgi:hypothetical protein